MNLLITKRHEYISDVIANTRDRFVAGIRQVYVDAQKVNRSRRFLLRDFQNMLSMIPTWTDEKQASELKRFCDVVHQLTRMVYNVHVCNIKMFAPKRLDAHAIALPPFEGYPINKFIQDCYVAIAREVWKKPQLFYDKVEKAEYNKNMKDVEKIVVGCIKLVLRGLLPLDQYIEEVDMVEIADNIDNAYDNAHVEHADANGDDEGVCTSFVAHQAIVEAIKDKPEQEEELVVAACDSDHEDDQDNDDDVKEPQKDTVSLHVPSSSSSSSSCSSSSSSSESSDSDSDSDSDTLDSDDDSDDDSSDSSSLSSPSLSSHKKVIYVNTDDEEKEPKPVAKRPTGTALEKYNKYAKLDNLAYMLMNRHAQRVQSNKEAKFF